MPKTRSKVGQSTYDKKSTLSSTSSKSEVTNRRSVSPSQSAEPDTSQSAEKKSKCVKVVKKSEREIRLLEVEDLVQKGHNVAFLNGDYNLRFKFKIGDGVIAFSDGLYYEGTILCYYRARAPDSIFEPDEEVPIHKQIPTYWVRFSGWSQRFDEEVAENEMTSREPTDPLSIFGMLYAHEWNEFRRELKNYTQAEMGVGSWFLTDEDYTNLEEQWKEQTGSTIGFTEFCGGNLPMELK